MKRTTVLLSLLFLAATSTLVGQAPSTSNSQSAPATNTAKSAKKAEVHLKPFSEVALGGGISLMGVNLQAATNVDRHLNLRVTGNVFNYTVNNITTSNSDGTNGFNLNGKVNFATAGASLDYFPFPTHGFRLSPGVLFYNQNGISASATEAAGNSFTLNGTKYYSDATIPLNVAASLGLNSTKPAFTLTTG